MSDSPASIKVRRQAITQQVEAAIRAAAQTKGSMLTQTEIDAVYAQFPDSVPADVDGRAIQERNEVLSATRGENAGPKQDFAKRHVELYGSN
jgi:hypothetical protein